MRRYILDTEQILFRVGSKSHTISFVRNDKFVNRSCWLAGWVGQHDYPDACGDSPNAYNDGL